MTDQPAGLIGVLLNPLAPPGDRDDAAIDLRRYPHPEAEAALVSVASDPLSDPELADTCGESLAEIWLHRRELKEDALRPLTWPALHILVPTILAKRRDWAPVVKAALDRRADVDWKELSQTVGPWFGRDHE